MTTRLTAQGAASAAPSLSRRRPSRGFTLPEIIFAVVILAIMTRVTMMKLVTPATLTLPAQAKSAAEQVRRAQTLAMARGQRMRVDVTTGKNGTLTIACASSAPACPDDAAFVLKMDQDVVVGAPSQPIYFNSLGLPVTNEANPASATPRSGDITMSLTFSGATQQIRVAAMTGRVTVSP